MTIQGTIMTSKTIYQQIKQTYLYIKQHSITKKKYFGKTTKDPYKYNGSGSYWLKHIKKHGKEHIVTLWVSNLYYDTSIVDVALYFSFENNIVESSEWANQKPENGLDGGDTSSGKKRTAEQNAAKSARMTGILQGPRSEEFGKKQSSRMIGIPRSIESNAKCSVTMTGIPQSKFFSIIDTRKIYTKANLSRYYPEFKQYY